VNIMLLDIHKYTFFTRPETSISSLENKDILNDFDINNPVDFNANHILKTEVLNQYLEALNIIGIENPSIKINSNMFEAVKKRIHADFTRLLNALNEMKSCSLENVLFITIGNSMESYGYILNKVFPQYKIGHVKVSRTLKDNVENYLGETNRIILFQHYFQQKISEIIQKYYRIEIVVIIDTLGAGETMSTILYPFIKKGLTENPSIRIIPACLLEGGNTKPTSPYDKNIVIVSLIEAENYINQLDNFKKSECIPMPVFTFNEYIPLNIVEKIILNPGNNNGDSNNANPLFERFGLKKLKIFMDVQKMDVKNKGTYIVIPSETTRLLSHINPYFTVGQKTVFISQEKRNLKFLTRDGHGFSRKEVPPMKLHQLNNYESFFKLSVLDKVRLLFNRDVELLNLVSGEVKEIVSRMDSDYTYRLRDAFESYLRKKIIYHFLGVLEEGA
jgi:hypothetical protein